MTKLPKWIAIETALPNHLQRVRVKIQHPFCGSFEADGYAIFLRFEEHHEGVFFDPAEQMILIFVDKWRAMDG